MEKLYQHLPEELVTFILVTVFSLLIGLSLRRISLKREGETTLFGTDRTFTFIGILGYLLYILDPVDYRLFMGGGAVLGLLLALNYYVKQAQFHVFGVTTIVIALITYCIAPIVATQPSWFYVMVIVTVLLFTELKHTFTELAQLFDNTAEDVFTAKTNYKSLDEWSSLVALSIISMVDEEFDKRLTGADLRSMDTIEDLYNLIFTK